MTYDRKRITGFIAALGLAGAAAAAQAQDFDNMTDWDTDRDQRISEDEFRVLSQEEAPWRAELGRGFTDPEGEGVDNLVDFDEYDANRDRMIDEEEFATAAEQNEGWDLGLFDTDEDRMVSEPEYMAGAERHMQGVSGQDTPVRSDFATYDRDRDRMLNEDEFAAAREENEDWDFEVFDGDDDMMVSETEYTTAAGIDTNTPRPGGVSGPDIDNLYDFGEFDADQSGDLDEAEYTAYRDRARTDESEGLFASMDENSNGFISESEFEDWMGVGNRHLRGVSGQDVPTHELQFAELDDDGDGFIGRDEIGQLRDKLYAY
jgi:Ca2+-binding EF-hand superfamily protein